MASELNDAKGTVDSTNAANLPPTGYGPDSPQAKEAIARLEEIKRIRTSGLGFTAKSAILGGAAGANAAKGSLDPVSAFMQGAAAGLQIPSMLAQQKKDQLTSAMDAAPLSISFPEIAAKYEYLAGMPTKLAIQTIQQIAIDTQKLAMTSNLKQAEQKNAVDLSMIKTEEEAAPYAMMFNQAYNLTGKDAVLPAELINARREDIDNLVKLRAAGKTTSTESSRTQSVFDVAIPELQKLYTEIPVQRPNPYHNMPEKVYEKVLAANSTNADKVITKSQQVASDMDQYSVSLKRALELLDGGLKTGYVVGNIPGRQLLPDAQEFNQIASKILPSMRSGMPGAVSDRDMLIFKDANFGITKDEKVNRNVIEMGLKIAERVRAKADFLANWKEVYGDIAGAESEWAKYVKANPLFDPKTKEVRSYDIQEGATGKAKDGTPVIRKGGKWVAQ